VSLIAIDTSAIVELMIEGPQALAVDSALKAATLAFVSSVARVETAIVMMGRFGWTRPQFDLAWAALGVEELPVDTAASTLAVDAFEKWGKGRGTGASLNFGDCFSHALATGRKLPLLFVGEDFARAGIDRV
jgi:ribonuclease VapC